MSGLLHKMNQILDPPLKRKMDELQKKMEEAAQLLRRDETQKQNRQRMHIFNTASWLEESRKALDDARKSIEDKIGQVYAKGYLWPVRYSRLKVVRAIDDTNKKVLKLLEQGASLCAGASGGRGCPELVGDRARAAAAKIGVHALREREAGVTRVLGMPGAGKTAVVSTAYEEITRGSDKGKRIFSGGVFWARMGANESEQGLGLLQRRIAQQIGVDLDLSDEKERASKLGQYLVQIKNKGKFLLILDLWGSFTPDEIGIPNGINGEIIVICRSLKASQVKFDLNGSVAVEDFFIQLLSEEEARKLFCKIVGVTMPDKVLSNLMKECDRLPAAIVDLAQSAKQELSTGDGVCDEAVINRFRELSAVQCRLKNNYTELNQTTKTCFVYCASLQEDVIERHKLIKLVAYWMWSDTREVRGALPHKILHDRTERGENILGDIIRAHLLEEERGEKGKRCIRISKIARDVANLINTPSQETRYLVDSLCTDKKCLKIMERASLSSRQLRDLGRQPEFSKMITLVARKDEREDEEPWSLLAGSFFSFMKNIQVLDLSHTGIKSLPCSFSDLENLRALLLHHCPNLTRVSSVAKFGKLIVMNLSDTPITRLPKGAENLKQLVRINISRTRIETLPFTDQLLKSWEHLKEVIMMSTYLWTGKEGLFSYLRKMEKLQVNFLDAQAFYSFVYDETNFPEKFKFCVGRYHTEGQRLPDETLALIGDCDEVFAGGSGLLPEKLAELQLMYNKSLIWLQCIREQSLQNLGVLDIYYCRGLLCLFSFDMLKHVPNVKRISIDRCSQMKWLINSEDSSAQDADGLQSDHDDGVNVNVNVKVLTKLESLVFIKAKRLIGIYNGEGIGFESLKSIAIWKCESFKELPVIKREGGNLVELHGESTRVEEIFSKGSFSNSYKHVNDKELVTKRSVKLAFSGGRSWKHTIINAITASAEIGITDLMRAR